MATKKPSTVTQLRQAKVEIARLEERNEELHKQWTKEISEHARAVRELTIANARCMKLKGIIEYLEDQTRKQNESK